MAAAHAANQGSSPKKRTNGCRICPPPGAISMEAINMKIVVVIARVFLGFIFVFFGSNGFLNFLPAPPLAGVAGSFLGALMSSHYVYMVCAVQILAGLMLLANQFVPLGLALL